MSENAAVTYSVVPLLMLLSSLIPAAVIFTLREDQVRLRTTFNLAGAIAKVGFVIALIPPVVDGQKLRASMPWAPGLEIVLVTDAFALFFVGLSALLWLLTTIYAIGYLEGSPNRSRFFGFFSLCVTATTGIALSSNLLTFLLFYELLTLVTYPLVAHRGTKAAHDGARTYLAYTLGGGVVLLGGVVWLTALVGPVEFTAGGVQEVADLAAERPATAAAVAGVLLAGLAVKAAIFPLHGWLPVAMVAPAPVSALLHAVAVVKAGAFGIVRVVHDVFGVAVLADLGVLSVLAAFAAFTIVYGSLRALMQDDLKKRLAYSTVSQLSYVALGAALLAPMATAGALVHIVHQGLMKITLFFCAGLFAEVLGLSKVSQLAGVGRRMPVTSAAFTVGALGMIGLPPIAGFVSKWPLALGGLDAGHPWVVAVLVTSTLLNAAYFLPILYTLWVADPEEGAEWSTAPHRERPGALEAPLPLLVPAALTACFALAVGVLAGWDYSPWALAQLIAEGSYP
ncbi:proton-conducting transporter transmembrane domain-containing protein [Nocardioides massiliensis]|uniref:Multicomponent Na+:H+ antiporter subunit D n=1 Tax=Nocardioides massiliensis TaxID=1325935 RepID=A0ABT9NRK9_9ACTN|nr:proton-conducting transporter membrane subunit [Nocardioides massiliensis]MDP9822690.1 multicomponent Na+:H+ antiporter subunit D [Nocardioides massiliensis]